MTCKTYRQKLSAYLDGELDTTQTELLEAHLASCAECASMRDKLARVGEDLDMIRFAKPHDDVLDKYESHVFTKIERGVAWVLLSISAAILGGAALFFVARDFFMSAEAPFIVRVGVGVGMLGLIVLSVGVVRHRIAIRKTDKYKGVIR
jgi:predicted anti-sigma-YlaC factor YlaD